MEPRAFSPSSDAASGDRTGLRRDAAAASRVEQELEALRVLTTAASVVAGGTGTQPELRSLSEIALPALADWCIIDVVDPDGRLELTASAAADPARDPVVQELRRRYPPTRGSGHLPSRVVSTGEPVLLLRTSPDELRRFAVDDSHYRLLRELGVCSVASVPLETTGRVVGAMTFGMGTSGRTLAAGEIPLLLEYGRLVGLEITSSRMRDELRGRERASSVLDRLRDGVVVLDAGNRIRLWNPAAARLSGVPGEAAVGRRIDAVIPAWSSEVSQRSMGSDAHALVPHSPGTGAAERWLLISGEQWDDGSVYAIRDVTAERELEEARREMVATVSHQLRTPLASIYASAVSLTREDIELEEQTRDLLLRIIVEQSEQLDQLSQDTLLAAKVASAQPALDVLHVDVRPLIENIAAALRLPLGATHRIDVDVPDEPLVAMADAHSLTQVLSNLLDNAIKYSPDGGTVTVRAARIEDGVEITVEDEGIGLEPSESELIFDRFYRADPNMLHGVGGTGLGLYVVRRLVQMMNGTVCATPLEVGTRFTVRLAAV